jgi:hypothetical protein
MGTAEDATVSKLAREKSGILTRTSLGLGMAAMILAAIMSFSQDLAGLIM